MSLEEYSYKLEIFLSKYRHILGLFVLIMLIVTCILTWQNFDKQNQIIETGGFTDGKIKCVCDQESWEEFESKDIVPVVYIPNG